MCGIAGTIFGSELERRSSVKAMTDALKHRGPDDYGIWSDEHCTLGHRRLSIIDLSEAGRQPMSSIDGTVWITQNGEIYNYLSLRRELENSGHQFRTQTDTEVLIAAYQQWGIECVNHLRGMFAFGLWDKSKQKFFLARDRVGKKPLFYTTVGNRFLFASELQGLLADPKVPREVNMAAIDSYLAWGYIPAPQTGFSRIYKLPPAHWLEVDVASGKCEPRIQRYWKLNHSSKQNLSESDAADALREKLTEAVKLRMISDVPLGAFLSGGIDSSIVVGLMAKLSTTPVKTFSIGFEEDEYNELDHARRIANRWNTDHHEMMVRPDALSILPKLVRHYGEPYGDSSCIPTFYVSQITRSHVTVALNGDGGDESFAGYERYLGNKLADSFQKIPGNRIPIKVAQKLLPDSVNPKSRVRSLKRFLSAAILPPARRYGQWIGVFCEEEKDRLYTADFKATRNGNRPNQWFDSLFASAKDLDPIDAAMAVDIDSYLPYDLLVKVDITSMSNALEARSPFLDHEVMELAASLPVNLKLKQGNAKYLLKHAFADLLPPENVNRRKMGFGVPVGKWFRGELSAFLKDSLLSKEARERGYFDPAEVTRMVQDHLRGSADYGPSLWNLLMLELWHKEFIDS